LVLNDWKLLKLPKLIKPDDGHSMHTNLVTFFIWLSSSAINWQDIVCKKLTCECQKP